MKCLKMFLLVGCQKFNPQRVNGLNDVSAAVR